MGKRPLAIYSSPKFTISISLLSCSVGESCLLCSLARRSRPQILFIHYLPPGHLVLWVSQSLPVLRLKPVLPNPFSQAFCPRYACLYRRSRSRTSDAYLLQDIRASFCNEHSPLAVAEDTDRFTYRRNMNKKWNECLWTGIATYITVRSERTEDSGNTEDIVFSTNPFYAQKVEEMLRVARENAENRNCPEEGKMTWMYESHWRRASCASKVL